MAAYRSGSRFLKVHFLCVLQANLTHPRKSHYLETNFDLIHGDWNQVSPFKIGVDAQIILSNFPQEDRKLFIVLVSFLIAVCKNWIRREEGYILSYLLRGSIHRGKVNQSAGVRPQLITLHLKSGNRDK